MTDRKTNAGIFSGAGPALFGTRCCALPIALVTLGLGGAALAETHYHIEVEEISCRFCLYGIEKKLCKLDGVTEIKSNQRGTLENDFVIRGGFRINFQKPSQKPRVLRCRPVGSITRRRGAPVLLAARSSVGIRPN